MSTTTVRDPLDSDCWLAPGSAALAVLLPEVHEAHSDGLISDAVAADRIAQRLRTVVSGAMADLGVQDRSLIDDLVQIMHQRVATMDAAARFDPSRGSATTYLHGIARVLIREQLWRRERPDSTPSVTIDRLPVDGAQLDRIVRGELLAELRGWLGQLSPGEVRALVHEFGPLFDYSPPIGRPRRPRNPNALPEAIRVLQRLGGARQAEQ